MSQNRDMGTRIFASTFYGVVRSPDSFRRSGHLMNDINGDEESFLYEPVECEVFG